jgi:alpha-tubulin suppressor-like RCC1 family protein
VEAGAFHTCIVRRSGVVSCWGKNVDGQLGDGTSVRRSTPGDVLGVANVVQLSISSDNAVARTASGTVFQWGNTVRTPATVSSLTDAQFIAAGDNTTCARRTSGETVCWGRNSDGQFGDGSVDVTGIATPTPLAYLRNAPFFEPGFRHFCAKLESGVVVCAGANFFGQMGNGTFSDVDQVFAMPVRFP